MKMKASLILAVIAFVLALNLCAFADQDEVIFRGNVFCLGVDDCRDFANWGPTAGNSYVVLYDADGHTISDYLWIDSSGLMTFQSELPGGGFAELPPAGSLFLGGLIETGSPQEVDVFFPGFPGSGRTLLIASKVDTTTPEPSTLLLLGPAALFLFGRARRFWRT
jgi:hypothetical protein